MKILILEDNPNRIYQFHRIFKNQILFIFDNVLEAINSCQDNIFDVMFLDHDLDNKIWVKSSELNTGYSFVQTLITNNWQRNALIYIHSMNPIGANNMLNLLKDNGYDGIWIPFHQLSLENII